MDSSFVLYLGRHTLETALLLSAPILLTCIVVGVVVTTWCVWKAMIALHIALAVCVGTYVGTNGQWRWH